MEVSMKKKLRGIKRSTFQLDFDLYLVKVAINGLAGANLSVIDLHPEGIKQSIVFVHGFAGCGETWEHQINHFAREFRVIVPDLRGHGQSDAPYSQYTMDEMVEDLHSIIKALNLPEQFVLVGHSFGGSICVEFANAYPDRLEKLVLIATAGEYPLPRAASWLSRIPTAVFRPVWKYRPRWNAELHVMKRMLFNNLHKWKGWALLQNITTPTLIITGERDTYFPREVFDKVARMIPHAEVNDVGKAKHKVQLERHQAVNRALERFIKGEKRSSWRYHSAQSNLLQRRPWLSAYGPDVPHTIPIPRQPLHRFLESAASSVPKRKAVRFCDTSLTYKQLNNKVNQFAHALLGLGVHPGDRVMILLPNMPQLIIAHYATLKIGGVVVVPTHASDTTRIVQQARQTDACVLIMLDAYSQLAETIQSQISAKTIVFATLSNVAIPETTKKLLALDKVDENNYAMARSIGYMMDELMSETSMGNPQNDVAWDSLAAVVFTSGTTDEPKGVCLTHANLVANTMQIRHWLIRDVQYGHEVMLSVLPFLHSYGMTVAMNLPIAIGATIVLLPIFELQQVLKHIQTYKPTLFPGMPLMYAAINHASNVRSYGLASIKACISGGAPLPVEVQESFEKLTRGHLSEGYGLTEASPVTHAHQLSGTRKVGSIGVPLPNTDARIVDLMTGDDVPPGQIGELVIKGPQIMRGYWGTTDDDGYETVIRAGWLYTGDVAVMDGDGYFQIINRKRDTIMIGRHIVFPRDVEEVLYENNKVLEVAVAGVSHIEGGQKIKAFVVPRPGATPSKDELIDLCRSRLEEYAVPWDIEFREELPKSPVGRVLRRLLVETKHES
jgi:long-chain acyl-CoA synthetase